MIPVQQKGGAVGERDTFKIGKQKKWIVLGGLLLALVAASGIGMTFAKYSHGDAGQTMVKAPEFYFTSDLLTAVEPPHYVLNSSVNKVTFYIRNRADEYRVSEVPINYNVTVNDAELISGTIAAGASDDVAVVLSNMEPGETYTVTATGEAGYTQTLTASFTVSDKDENVYKNLMVSRDGYMILTVWTHNVEGQLSVSFPQALIPDNTNTHMETVYNKDAGGSSSFGATFGKYHSQTYRFFSTGATYNADDFWVSVSGDGNTTYTAVEANLP